MRWEVGRGRGEPWGLLSSVLPGKSTQQNSAQFGGGGGGGRELLPIHKATYQVRNLNR